MNESEKINLNTVYMTMAKNYSIIDGARWAVLGPNPVGEKITDEDIINLREGKGNARDDYAGGLEYNMAIPKLAAPLIETDNNILKLYTSQSGYNAEKLFGYGADMLLLAQAGVLNESNMSEDTGLTWWRLNPQMAEVIPRNEDKYNAFIQQKIVNVFTGKTDELDEMILQNYR